MPPIRKDNLYSENSFIDYCTYDQFRGRKFDIAITSAQLRAAEKDELIVPLFIEKQVQKQGDKEEEVEVRYYSPFQIYLAVALMRNIVDDDGYLRNPDDLEWQKKQGTRYINWGGWSAFSVDSFKKKRGEEPDQLGNHFTDADNLHQALRLLHGLEQENRYELIYDKRRLLTGQTSFIYNLDPVRGERAEYLKKYDLDDKKLKSIVVSVGHLATHIDPLERWFYYIRLHSQFRRDQLKGVAVVSQDLYGFCDLVYDIIEIAFGEKLPPLLDFLHPDIKPFLMEKTEHATGDDIKAIRAALNKLEEWVKTNGQLIEELKPTIERSKLDSVFVSIKEQLDDYEKRYGDRRYVGSMRTIWPETKLKIENLDDRTKRIAQLMFDQTKDASMSQKELEENMAIRITYAIESRMGDLQRSVSDIAYRVAETTWSLSHKFEREKEMAKYPALEAFGKSVNKDDPDYARKYNEFWRTGIKEAERPIQEKMDRLELARRELHGIGNLTRLVFCAVCRSKPVLLHHGYNDAQVTSEAICDECLKSGKQLTVLGAGEWKCDRCGKMIYKFAHGNVLSDTLRNTSAVTIRLEYGRMEITAKCPDKDCRAEQTRAIDEGWLP